MVTSRLLVVSLAAALALLHVPTGAEALADGVAGPADADAYVPGVVIVQAERGEARAAAVAVAATTDAQGTEVTTRSIDLVAEGQLRVLEVEDGTEDAVVAALHADPSIAWAQRDRYVSAMGAPALPTDPRFNALGEYDVTRVPVVWPASGGRGITVAVLDSGVNPSDEVRASRLLPGWDFVNGDALPADDGGHGTMVAGVLVGTHSNGIAGAGVCPSCSILPVKVLGADGTGSMSAVADGIRYAADRGAKVINLSLGYHSAGDPRDRKTEGAIAYARSKGAVLFASAGNDGSIQTPSYPAAHDGVVAVTGIDGRGGQSPRATVGAWVDVAAPFSIPSVNHHGLPTSFHGTSAAAPHAAGIAALLWSAQPELAPTALLQRLYDTSARLPVMRHGSLDAVAALSVADRTPPHEAVLTGPHPGAVARGVQPLTAAGADDIGVARIEIVAGATVIHSAVPSSADPFRFRATAARWDTTAHADGPIVITARVRDHRGNVTTSAPLPLVIDNAPPVSPPPPGPSPSAPSAPAGPVGTAPRTGAPSLHAAADGTIRRSGADRYETAVAVTAATWVGPVDRVYIATGRDFPDALAAGAAAARTGSPVLLTDATSLPAVIAGELVRLAPREIIVVGGARAVTDGVLARLRLHAPTRRIAGGNRFATAAETSTDAFAGPVPVAYVAAGGNFPDALAGGPAAGVHGGPLLLTATTSLPDATAAALRRLQPARIVVLGNRGAVADAVLEELRTHTTGPVTRAAGASRFDTSVAVSAATFPAGSDVVVLATGATFPDALAGGPAAAAYRGPLLLTPSTALPAAVRAEITRLRPRSVFVLGGAGAVSEVVLQDARAAARR
jgi:putative cell wall-binding protein